MNARTSGNVNYISPNNSTTSTLTAGSTFTGDSDDVTIYKSIICSLYTNVNSAIDGLSIQFSTDNVNWDFEYNFSVIGGVAQSQTIQKVAQYFRVVYTNGASGQGSFRLQSILVANSDNSGITYPASTSNNSSQISAFVDGTTNLINITANATNALSTHISSPVDAYGNVSVSEKVNNVINTFYYNINSRSIDLITNGSATGFQETSSLKMSTGSTTGSTGLARSIKIAGYVPGTGIKVYDTMIFDSPATGTKQYVGCGDDTEGYFWGYTGDQFSIIYRKNNIETYVPQGSWNVDTMEGTGLSGFNLNPLTGNVYIIQVQWLGYGNISFSIETPYTGCPSIVHRIRFPNTLSTGPSLDIPAFHNLVEISNGNTSNNITLQVGCMAIYNEGSTTLSGILNSTDNETINISANQDVNILTLRNKTTFHGIVNRTPIVAEFMSVATDGNKPVRFRLIENALFTSSLTYIDINTENSIAEASTGTFSVDASSTGATILTEYLSKSDGESQNLEGYDIEISPGNTLSIVAFTTNATSDNGVALTWRELFT